MDKFKQYAPLIGGVVDENYRRIQAIGNENFNIETCEGFSLTGFISEKNAKILSAAPDLLESLIELYESLPYGYTSECLPKVRMAIKKATE